MGIRWQQNRESPALRMEAELQEIASETRGARGSVIPEWQTIATVRCALVPLSGQEAANAATMGAKANYKVVMRYYPDVTTKMRLKIGSRYFNIVHVATDEGYRHAMEIMVMEKLTGS